MWPAWCDVPPVAGGGAQPSCVVRSSRHCLFFTFVIPPHVPFRTTPSFRYDFPSNPYSTKLEKNNEQINKYTNQGVCPFRCARPCTEPKDVNCPFPTETPVRPTAPKAVGGTGLDDCGLRCQLAHHACAYSQDSLRSLRFVAIKPCGWMGDRESRHSLCSR